MRLWTSDEVEASDVAANCRMNREREIRGSNGYARDLGFDVVDFLRSRGPGARWLDVGCGTARAVIQADALLADDGDRLLTGVDLVPYFAPVPASARVRLVVAPIRRFEADPGSFDLVTSVHGLHYVADKLAALQSMRAWLRPGGILAAHLDARHVVVPGGAVRLLRSWGFDWHGRRHLVREGTATPGRRVPFLGAELGRPNFTGQPAVVSHYS